MTSLLRALLLDLISDSSHCRFTFLVFIFTEEGSFLIPWCHRNQIRYFLIRSGKRDPMASFQGRNPGLAGQTKSVTSTDVGSPRESEADDSSVSSKDQLRARVYSLLREVAHVFS
jgi:hypothetical protein